MEETMETKANVQDIAMHDADFEAEIVGVLFAISIVAKRLTKRLSVLDREADHAEEGGTP